MKTYYDLLEVRPDAPLKEITKSYFRLASKCHPDLVQRLDPDIQKLANEKMRELNLAYQVLKNEAERARYDLEIKGVKKPAVVQEPSPPPPPPPPTSSQAERKKAPYPWELVKDASLDRVKEILARSPLALKPVEGFLNPTLRVFQGKKGLTHFLLFIRIEETITPTIVKQTLSDIHPSLQMTQNWNPLQKNQSLVCLMGWGFHDLTVLKKMVQDYNRAALGDKKGPKKNLKPSIVLLDFTTEQIFAPDLPPAAAPLFAVLKDFSFKGR